MFVKNLQRFCFSPIRKNLTQCSCNITQPYESTLRVLHYVTLRVPRERRFVRINLL